MKRRPTIALAMIVKNEAHNLGPLLSSVSGCFDAIFVTDTGSTDTTLDILKDSKSATIAECPIFISHFDWVNDFAKARQFNFDQVGEEYDYVMWIDGDDVLSDKDAFIHWRDHTLHVAHQWLVNYNYAFNGDQPVCTFFRERVVKNRHGFRWNYFVHEGLVNETGRKVDTMHVSTWTIDHRRSDVDLKLDRSRNLKLFKEKESELNARMKYYYGKELFEADDFIKAAKLLQEVCALPEDSELQHHDRIMAMQYWSMALGQCGKWHDALRVAHLGLQLAPDRAEMWICAADASVRLNQHSGAILYYQGARHCAGSSMGGAIYTSPTARGEYPTYQLANLYLNVNNFEAAQTEVNHLKKMNHPSWSQFQAKIDEFHQMNTIPEDPVETEDIVISTPPGVVTSDWDEKVLKEKGMGGSETACVEVARLLAKKTGRPVKVFQKRASSDVMESGVEYLPIDQVENYFRRYKPKAHIAWRHASRLTKAPTYVWSHDLLTPGAERQHNYDKLWCLTGFHSHFVQDMQQVDPKKIDLVHNGIDPELFKQKHVKNPHKVFFSSSPDRGLERVAEICKLAKKQIPDLELHIFYGTANMRKMGMVEEADRLDQIIKDNDFINYHGFVPKKELVLHMLESAVWLYPADFIETSCITAMEAYAAGCWPIVRNMGALKYTMKDQLKLGMGDMLDVDANDEASFAYWAQVLVDALREEKHKKIDVSPEVFSWENRIDAYIKSMNL